jgi:hypothetical protein
METVLNNFTAALKTLNERARRPYSTEQTTTILFL